MTIDSPQRSKYIITTCCILVILITAEFVCCFRYRREEIIDVLKRVNFVLKQKNLPIFNVTSKDLRDFTTTEKDMNKSQSRFPTPNYRTKDEDLFVEQGGAAASQSIVTP